VTRHPTAEWLARQIIEAFPWTTAPKYLTHYNDGAYGHVFTARMRAMAIRDRPISPGKPWQNGITERLIAQKRLPALGRKPPAAQHVSRHCRLGDLKAQAVNPGCAPKRIFLAHPPDQITQPPINPWPPYPLSRLPAPIRTETDPMPAQHSLRLNHADCIKQTRP
jgi:hypothetical protein